MRLENLKPRDLGPVRSLRLRLTFLVRVWTVSGTDTNHLYWRALHQPLLHLGWALPWLRLELPSLPYVRYAALNRGGLVG
jgi:hypothetical protein